MALLGRAWGYAVSAWREDGLPGLLWLARVAWMGRRCRAVTHQMLAAKQEENRRWNEWTHAHPLPEEVRRRQALDRYPDKLSILIPVYNAEPEHLEALAESLLAQTCGQWEACFYEGASPREDTREALRKLSLRDPRLRVTFGKENAGISGNTNQALLMATGRWAALCDHDDLLAPDAVWQVLRAFAQGADMVYTDEDKCDETGETFFGPHLKPDFSPDSLRAGNYICHFFALKASLMRELGGLRPACDGSQDHDLALRASEKAQKIVHIPRVLYHWRQLNASCSHQKAQLCAEAAALSVREQLERLGMDGEVGTLRRAIQIRYAPPARATVTLVVRHGGSESWLRDLIQRAGYPVTEVLRVREDLLDDEVRRASGDYLVLIAGGVMPARGWLAELLSHAQHPHIACVGAPLTDRRNRYRHCGYAADPAAGAIPLFLGQCPVGPSWQLQDRQIHNVSGVSGALLCVRRRLFLELGGLGRYRSDLGALSLGLRAGEQGLYNLLTPRAIARAPEGVCLAGPAPEEDLQRFRREFHGNPPERFLPAALDRKGGMTVDFDRLGEVLR
ncbi:MAG: glycosyltransferase [Clostridia bacterium]|nr:glycosyltransferase [Clostridia bacterium]